MPFHALAYGPEEHALLTLDDAELLAHDAQTEAPKWRLTFELPLVAVLFADADALPVAAGANPWRNPSGGRCVVAVDAEGGVHVIDPVLGQKIGSLGPFGHSWSAAAGVGGTVALATDDKVLLWRSSELTEIPARATTIAFSNDGATLAIGGADGGLRFMSIEASKKPVETFCAVVHGGVSDVVQHPTGAWIVAGKSGVSVVDGSGSRRLDRLPAGVQRVRLNANGSRLAAQLTDRSVVVYSWPSLSVELRIEYIERPVSGLSFGPENWLGLALDHGDGNKIDVATGATHRTDTHPGRTHRSWLLNVQGKAPVLSATEAEDIRRMKDPFHAPAPDRSSGNNAGRVGIGVAISVGILCLRLCGAASRSSSPSYTIPDYNPYLKPVPVPTLGELNRRPVKHAGFVRLEGPALKVADTEDLPEAHALEGEEPGAIWTAPDGTVFLSTMTGSHNRSNVYRRDKTTGTWDVIATRRSLRLAQLWGRSAADLYIMDHDSLAHFNGIKTTEIVPPTTNVLALGGVGEDVFLAAASVPSSADADDSDDAPSDAGAKAAKAAKAREPGVRLHRRRASGASGWVVEPTVTGLEVKELWSAGGTMWGRALAPDGVDGYDDRLVQRSANGQWTERKWYGATRPGSTNIRAVWVSPTKDAFVATDGGIFRSANGGASWSKTGTEVHVDGLWGRSNTDVYATTRDGLLHYDGKAWSATSYTSRATAIGGTATDVLLGVAVAPAATAP
jgi:hypothetical protein